MTLPPIPDEAVRAVLRSASVLADVTGEQSWAHQDLAAAWPFLYAAAMRDFADRMDAALETVGVGEDPLTAYQFVVGCARELADEALALEQRLGSVHQDRDDSGDGHQPE